MGFQIQLPLQTRIGDVLGEEFSLPKTLMSRYEAILFLMHHRFNISSGKKKNAFGSLRDFEYCASVILSTWCVRTASASQQLGLAVSSRQRNFEGPESPLPVSMGVVANLAGSATPGASGVVVSGNAGEVFSPFELDTSLFARFRELKSRAIGLTAEMWTAISPWIESNLDRKRIEARFRPWFRALLSCATGKDLKDFFEDLNAGVVEPLVDMRCDAEMIFDVLDRGFAQLFSYADIQTWNALVAGIKPCAIRFLTVHPQKSLLDLDFDEES